MKKVKLPRRRKKAFIKAKGRSNYIGIRILGEILQEEGRKDAGKFITYVETTPTKEYPQGLKPQKYW